MPPIWVSDKDFVAIKALRRKIVSNSDKPEITKDESIGSVVSRVLEKVVEKNLLGELK
jgi:hypothetical protein